MAFSISLAKILDLAGLLNHSLVADACDCLISVFAVFFNCLLFLYYWEARQQEANAESEVRQRGGDLTRRPFIRILMPSPTSI